MALSTTAARNLATTTKTPPVNASATPGWLLRIMSWTEVPGGVYRRTSTVRRTIARHGSSQPGVIVSAGHHGEPALPGMYVEYGSPPREYELSVTQTVMRVHNRVEDLYSDPMDQYDQQLRLTEEALRERREHELINNPAFGLLHAPPPRHRVSARTGPPTPSDLDALICKQTRPRYLLAHPRAIAAFARQCNSHGIVPGTAELDGRRLLSWRGLPLLPCDKLPVAADQTTSILVVRPGERRQGIVGLRPEGGLKIHKLGTDDRAVTSYLVSDYFSVAVLIPNAVCALDGVQL